MSAPLTRPPRTDAHRQRAPHTRWFIDMMAHAAASGVASVTLPAFRFRAIVADLGPDLLGAWMQRDGTLQVFGIPVKVSRGR